MNTQKIKNWIIKSTTILFILPHIAFAHGEDKLGPNGGYIKMPGAFHTELVKLNQNEFKVYLLDMTWSNPSVKDSKLQASFLSQDKKTSTSAECKIEANYYLCKLPNTVDINKNGTIKVLAQRENQKANEALYTLPLKLAGEKNTNNPTSHQMCSPQGQCHNQTEDAHKGHH